jgi:deoxyribonuclease-4
MPNLGAHVSVAGGLHNAPAEAAALKLDSFQFFTRPPQSGQAPELTKAEIRRFLDACRKHKIKTWHVHGPYIINLASPEGRIRGNSIRLMREELERADALKAKSVIFHVGSAFAVGLKKGMGMVIDGVADILDGYHGKTVLAIETTAGAGSVIGAVFDEIGEILRSIKSKKLACCLDTCHSFAAGYGFSSAKEVNKTLKEFDSKIGLKNLVAIHLNDSAMEHGSHKDRHAHLGFGKIPPEGLMALLTDSRIADVDLLMETPTDDRRMEDVSTARRWLAGEKFYPRGGDQKKLV